MNVVLCACCCFTSFPLFLFVVPLNDKQTLEMRALSFDRDDDLGEPGLEEVLKAKKPREIRKGNPLHLSHFLFLDVARADDVTLYHTVGYISLHEICVKVTK